MFIQCGGGQTIIAVAWASVIRNVYIIALVSKAMAGFTNVAANKSSSGPTGVRIRRADPELRRKGLQMLPLGTIVVVAAVAWVLHLLNKFDDVTGNVGQTEVTTGVAVGQSFVIKPQEVQ